MEEWGDLFYILSSGTKSDSYTSEHLDPPPLHQPVHILKFSTQDPLELLVLEI